MMDDGPMTDDRIARIRQRAQAIAPGQVRTDMLNLLEEIDRIQGWGDNTMDGCVAVLTKARDALYGVLSALGLGYGASELLDEIDEAIRQMGAGKGD